MKKYQIFIDGQAGTTGLQIRQRLANHPQIDVVTIDHDKRRDADAKLALMRSVDVTVLCLPDDAAKETALQAREVGCRVLDASSAHRTASDWVFGMAELAKGQREAIAKAAAVSNPGCYATGAILLLRPLIEAGLLGANRELCINAISGYTGGGTKMVERYQQDDAPVYAAYGLGFDHKHIPEIQHWSGLQARPIFQPAVGSYDQGMLVMIPLQDSDGVELQKALSAYYQGEQFVQVLPYNEIPADTAPFITPHGLNGSNRAELQVYGASSGKQALLVAKLDNLGKGASGAAVQNLNIMLGLDEGLCTQID
ncbi:N-acetyl-gamma-glutamyl-phosphate reductase [Pseudomonas seleniipraecipitans]|uniref:N-acetyl-gamma-glutamyl-phosphate reductase n=1 Tax=Phytopseudomonas seleniipraecipitans TaxID=640205 RepID=A0ABY5J5Z2_9GAMM|nr:N-acetyl-gamma-glutamyl-phosphate reductase [Pseudomonas seleniipraecipitans]UUD63494.1 N-acetyl-gamma-glutamyl-phosphate reductase [Pseudomonas seleniipraecipitans]